MITTLLLLAVLPTLSQENYEEVRNVSNNQPIDVLFVTDNCVWCDVIKDEVPITTYMVHEEKQSEVFRRITQGHIRQFPTLGVLSKGRAIFYSGSDKIRKVLNSRPPRFK